eukprot:TRINITY_DN102116_c0_g1_i1.p1 TRINITY_DN102116_c0_g1~~TRINITY_DN102116_c0_g1_i1.p1  ORF type:complete len:306 (-),score=113.82 TRINITY_DN102116_c0_g1_i1:97-957(-)
MAALFSRAALLSLLVQYVDADHPCTSEIASACPERPVTELVDCLKNSGEHENPTEISSECTDFIALNKACTEDMEKSCDDAMFSDDTVLCLTKWIEPEALTEKCKAVLQWAVPSSEEEEAEEGFDELGMSQKDREEKEEWQKKRKAVREEAIERMKMKEVDRKKEEERRALEDFKNENPEGYADMMRQKEEDRRQQEAQKRRERQIAAAMERKKRQEQGEADEEDATPKAKKGKTSSKGSTMGGWMRSLGTVLILAIVGMVAFYLFGGGKKGGSSGGKSGGKKKRH